MSHACDSDIQQLGTMCAMSCQIGWLCVEPDRDKGSTFDQPMLIDFSTCIYYYGPYGGKKCFD